jgi:polar amino acid transport system substrate-binding protein
MTARRIALRRAVALAVALWLVTSACLARTLAEVTARGVISMCANPDALPHSSNRADAPGFQIEIGRALATALGFPLQVEWIIPRIRAGLVDCDILLDTIADNDVQRAPLRLSHPYQKSGVALAFRSGVAVSNGFKDLAPGLRVGVLVNSVASKLLSLRGVRTVPYAFESEMVDDLAKGELDACAVSPASIAYFIYRHPDAGLRYVHAYDTEPELQWDLAVGLRRSDDALQDAVNVALDKLIGDGTLARIYAQYGVQYRRP